MYNEERDVLEEEIREIDECDMEKFGTLFIDSSEKTIAILGDRRWGPRRRHRKGIRSAKSFCLKCMETTS